MYYNKGITLRNKKKFNKSRAAFINAKESLNRNDVYSAYKVKYGVAIYGNKRSRSVAKESTPRVRKLEKPRGETAVPVKASSVTKPFILALSNGESLENAIVESLNPDSDNIKSITDSMSNYKTVSWVKSRKYLPKKKKYKTVYTKKYNDYEFKPGIFIVHMDRNMRIVKANRVSKIYLDHNKYQNHQYLKNSYFTQIEQTRDL